MKIFKKYIVLVFIVCFGHSDTALAMQRSYSLPSLVRARDRYSVAGLTKLDLARQMVQKSEKVLKASEANLLSAKRLFIFGTIYSSVVLVYHLYDMFFARSPNEKHASSRMKERVEFYCPNASDVLKEVRKDA